MKGKTETILLVLIIVALSAYLVFRKTERTQYRLPALPEVPKEDVTRIEVKRGDSEILLQQEGDRWVILPEGYPADPSAVDSMLEVIGNLQLTALVSASENDSVYDLDESKGIQVTAFEGQEPVMRLRVGKPAPSHRHTFVKLEGDSRIYHVEGNFRSRFEKDVPSLRDKQVLKIDEEISEIILSAGKESLHVLRKTASVEPEEEQPEGERSGPRQGGSRWETLEGKPVKPEEIDTLVRTLSNLKCDGYLESTKADWKEPSFNVSLKGNKNYEISLYGDQENKVVATSSENEYPFLISDWKAKRIRKDLKDLVENGK